MILLTVEEIISLHSKLIEKTGGSSGLRDIGLLESAVYSTEASFETTELYPSVEEKAARLMYALTNNHAFFDGNKRVGVLSMLVTLEVNGKELCFSQKELIDLSLSVASGEMQYDDVLAFILGHLR